MSLATTAELESAIADWLNRTGSTDLVARVPDFIRLFESQFDKMDMRHPKALKRSTALLDSEYTAVPTDFVEMQRLRVVAADGSAQGPTLRYLTPEEFEDEELNGGTRSPAFFTIVGAEIQVKLPAPTGTSELEMLYWSKLTPLSTVASNWLLLESPECYLFGALCEAFPFIRDEERNQFWEPKRDAAVARLRDAAERARHTHGTLKPRRRKLG